MTVTIPTPLQLRARTSPARRDTAGTVHAAIHLLAPSRDAELGGRVVAAAATIGGQIIHYEAVLPDEQTSERMCVADAFIDIYRRAQRRGAPLRIYIAGTELRALLAGGEIELPGVEVARGMIGPQGRALQAVSADARRAGGALLDRLAEQADAAREAEAAAARAERLRHRDVYTDGSVSARRKGCGAAVVGEDGRVHTRVAPTMPNRPVLAELLAVELALIRHDNVRLTVHTDSRDAIGLLTAGPAHRSLPRESAEVGRQARRIAARIDALAADRRVRYRWVRGHAGNPFNDAADRAAKAVRRCHTFATGGEAMAAVMRNIDQDLRPHLA